VTPVVGPTTTPAGGPKRRIQWPFVGVAVLLVALILLTPNLFLSSSPGLETRAELVVDRASVSRNTTFYVESIGTSTRYQSIIVGLAPLPVWPYKGSMSTLSGWSWTNGTDTLVLTASEPVNPVAVNVTVKYTDPAGVTTEYVGVYGFYLNSTTLTLDAMTLLPGTSAPPAATPLADLPIFLLLAIQTPSGPTQ
jgi:hypothetical protein